MGQRKGLSLCHIPFLEISLLSDNLVLLFEEKGELLIGGDWGNLFTPFLILNIQKASMNIS